MNSTNTESSDLYLNLEHFTLLDPSSPRAIPELEGVYVWALKPDCTLPRIEL